jgi:hypothetical protein
VDFLQFIQPLISATTGRGSFAIQTHRMTKKITILPALAISALYFSLLTACSKPIADNPVIYTPTTYAQGDVDGLRVEQNIGSSGGQITSADGKLTLSIPAGALSSNTQISIQGVTRSILIGAETSYRILPADITLAKPVTISLSYDETQIDGFDEDVLDLIRQDNTGTWKRIKNTQIDKTVKTLMAESAYLGDYSFTGSYRVTPDKTGLGEGESAILIITTVQEEETGEDEKEAALGRLYAIDKMGDVETWTKRGAGEILPRGTTAEFKAPVPLTGQITTEVFVTIKNINRKLRSSNGKLQLKRKITMSSESFMSGYYDGTPFTCVGVTASIMSGVTMIQGVTAGGKTVLIMAKGTNVANYPYGNPAEAGKAEIRCDISGVFYETVYTVCGTPSSTKYAGGGMTITNYQNGGTIAGEFTATLYDDFGCQLRTKKITGVFKVKR